MWNMVQILDVADRWRFRSVVRVTVESNRNDPIDKLTAILPLVKRHGFDPEKIKKGDRVVWRAGYKEFYPKEDDMPIEFEGKVYEIGTPTGRQTQDSEKALTKVAGVAASSRVWELVAYDPMQDLKWIDLKATFANSDPRSGRFGVPTDQFTSAIEAASKIPFEIQFDRPTVNPSDGIFLPASSGKSVLYSLWKLRKVWEAGLGVDVYFRNGKIVLKDAGDLNFVETETIPVFVWGKNIIKDDLVARPGKILRIRVRGYRKDDYGLIESETIKGEYPETIDSDAKEEIQRLRLGDTVSAKEMIQDLKEALVRTFDIDNLQDSRDAKNKARQIHEQLVGDGYTGSFLTFGYPRALIANPCLIVNSEDRRASKLCIVDAVKKVFDVPSASYTQEIMPGNTPQRIINALTLNRQSSSGSDAARPKAVVSGGDTYLSQIGGFLAGVFSDE